MDCSSSSDNLRPATIQPEDSFELELGASASRVDTKTVEGSESGGEISSQFPARKNLFAEKSSFVLKPNFPEKKNPVVSIS